MLTRRQVAKLVTVGSGALIGVGLLGPIVGFIVSPIVQPQTPLAWRKLGRIDHLPLRQPKRYVVRFPQGFWSDASLPWGAFVVRESEQEFKVFSNICTHMQCAVRWQANLNQFECPCHGGFYNLQGVNIGGPPPKPLPQWVHKMQDGELYIANRLEESI